MCETAARVTPPGGRHLRLSLPGGVVEVVATSERTALLEELRTLWGHVLVPLNDDHREEGPEFVERILLTDTSGKPDQPDAVAVEDGPGAAYTVSGRVTRGLLTRLLGSHVLLHAGAVALPEIGTVLLVGPSGAGKSTATTLLARGGGYLSDEVAIIDPTNFQVTGYPKPVSRIDPAETVRVKRDHGLVELELQPAWTAEPPAVIALLTRTSDTSEPSVRRVPMAEAISRLIEQSSSIWKVQDPLGTLARLIEGAGGVVEAKYAEAESLLTLLRELPPAVHEDWECCDPDADKHEDTPPGTISVAPYVQALHTESGSLVLREGGVVRLLGAAAWLWDALAVDGAAGLESLRDLDSDNEGPRPDHLEDALAALREAGLICEQ